MKPIPINIIRNALKSELNGKHFGIAVDLGCGSGESAPIIRDHVDYLIGVDISEEFLDTCNLNGFYDELVNSDIRTYSWPRNVDVIFFIEVLEHIPHEDGERLIRQFHSVPNIILTTPATFFPNGGHTGPHLSLWTEEELKRWNFETRIVSGLFRPPIIFATRYNFGLGWRS